MEGVAGVHLMAIEWEHRVAEIEERAKMLPRPVIPRLLWTSHPDQGAQMTIRERNIIAFLCNWCTYNGPMGVNILAV